MRHDIIEYAEISPVIGRISVQIRSSEEIDEYTMLYGHYQG